MPKQGNCSPIITDRQIEQRDLQAEYDATMKAMRGKPDDAFAIKAERKLNQPDHYNETLRNLIEMAEVFSSAAFQAAIDELHRRGLAGHNLRARIDEARGPYQDVKTGLIVHAIRDTKARHPDLPYEKIFELVAVSLALRSQSFEGAVKKVRRTWVRWKDAPEPDEAAKLRWLQEGLAAFD